MNKIDRAYRDQQIAIHRALGRTEKEVGATFGISVRSVRRAVKRYKQSRPKVSGVDPADQVDLYLQQLDVLISDLALIEAGAKNPRTKLAAMSRKLRAMREQFRVLTEVGFLPSGNLTSERLELRAEHAAQLFQWIKKSAGEEHGLAIAPWLGRVIEDWVENGDQGPLSRERDTFMLESVLWRDADESEDDDDDHRADHRAAA